MVGPYQSGEIGWCQNWQEGRTTTLSKSQIVYSVIPSSGRGGTQGKSREEATTMSRALPKGSFPLKKKTKTISRAAVKCALLI